MGHHLITEVAQEKYTFNGKSKLIAIILIVLGVAMAGFGSMQVKENWGGSHDTEETVVQDANAHADHAEHGEEASHAEDSHGEESASAHGGEKSWTSRLWANLLMNSYYFLLFALGALFFIAVNYVANAGWATMLKRISEAITAYVGIGIVLLVGVIFMAKDQLYHWLEYFSHGYTSADIGHYDKILESKSWFLNSNILFIVFPIVLVIWYFFRWKFRSNSIKEDAEGGLSFFRNSTRWSAAFIFIFAFTFSAMAWLVIMSIDAHWYSTMFSVYNFAVAFVTGLTVTMMILLYLKSKGYMEMVSDEVVHDLGKFMFAFSIFWGYIFLGQWLLIWYANIPEEVVYFNARFKDGYSTLFYVNIIMCFVLPFLILMMRNAKRNPLVLTIAGSIILVGHWIDMYLMVMPGTVAQHGGIGLLEIGTTMAFAGVFIYVVLYSLSKANLYTTNHPYFLESANHDVGP